jgi:hypothetical protein
MAIASFAGLGLSNGLAFADRLGLAGGFAFANRLGFACGSALADRLGFACGSALADRLGLSGRSLAPTNMIGLFNTLAAIYVRGCFADVITFASKPGLIIITITIIV